MIELPLTPGGRSVTDSGRHMMLNRFDTGTADRKLLDIGNRCVRRRRHWDGAVHR